MEKLLEILNDINPGVDFETEENLVDGRILDSLSILTLISRVSDTFNIEIGFKWMSNENFNSARAMWNMIQTIIEED